MSRKENRGWGEGGDSTDECKLSDIEALFRQEKWSVRVVER